MTYKDDDFLELYSERDEVRRNAGKVGHWRTSLSYEYIAVIKEWHRLPSEFGICESCDDLNFMMAYERISAKITDWERD